MQEYKFEPDYATWWENKKLSKEQICWLMLGINPDDVVKYENPGKEEGKKQISDDDINWQHSFSDYLGNLPNGFRSYHNHDSCMKILNWAGDKKDIVKQFYENYFEFPESIRIFLNGRKILPRNEVLEVYKDHNKYAQDKDISLDNITKEEEAFSVLLGFQPKHFLRFCALEERQKNEPRDKNNFVAYVRFSAEDKWFYSEYRKFIVASYEGRDEHFIAINAWEKAKKLNVWNGCFKQYAQRLFNEGFIFRKDIMKTLKALGISLEYEKDGWAFRFYKTWDKKGGWTIAEAVNLFKGISPKEKEHSYTDLSQNLYILNLSANNTILSWDSFSKSFEHLENTLERHIAVKKLDAFKCKESALPRPIEITVFCPKKIVEWLLAHTLHIPPAPLLQLLNIPKTEEGTENRIAANIKASEEQAKAKRNSPEIHQCIGWAWDSVSKQTKRKPEAQEVWNKLSCFKDKFDCIQSMEYCKEKREDAILWTPQNGQPKHLTRATFNNLVSNFNGGEKKYDPSQNNF